MKIWVLLFENYKGDNFVELYSTKEKAKKAFAECMEANKDKNINVDFGMLSWFDSSINEFSTYVTMYEQEIDCG